MVVVNPIAIFALTVRRRSKVSKRIYLVKHGKSKRLVRASNCNQAIRHVAESMIAATVATQDELVQLLQEDSLIEDYGNKEVEV